jgi:hypothetical protein
LFQRSAIDSRKSFDIVRTGIAALLLPQNEAPVAE